MLFLSLFGWWYGHGWAAVATSFGRRMQGVAEAFSVGQLLRTLFAPWRRIISYPGASLGERMRAWSDNAFSRVIGFVVRLFVLLAGGICLLVVGLVTAIETILWPLVPVAVPVCLVWGIL